MVPTVEVVGVVVSPMVETLCTGSPEDWAFD